MVNNNLATVIDSTRKILKQKQSADDEFKKFEAILSKKVSDLEEIHKKQIEDIQKSFKEILNSQQQLIVKLQTEVKERDEIIARLSKEVDELKKSRIQQPAPQVINRSIVTSNTNDIGPRKIVPHNSNQNNFSTVFDKATIDQNQHRKAFNSKSGNRGKSHSRSTDKTEMLSHSSQFGLSQLLERTLIGLGIGQPTTTVTAVMIDVEGLISLRRRCQFRYLNIGAEGVGIMIAGRTVKVADNLFARRGGIHRQAGDNRYDY